LPLQHLDIYNPSPEDIQGIHNNRIVQGFLFEAPGVIGFPLVVRVEKEKIKEVILANNTDVEGEATASYLARLLSSETVRVSRIASGIPIGCDIKYTDQVTLKRALEGRRDMEGC
jgi:hypothetical protein